MNNPDKVTYFAETDSRNKRVRFGIKEKDRTQHVYVIGKTGVGKSTLLENMAIQDIQQGNGFAFMDPHGKTAELLLEYIPESRQKDVLYFAPFDTENPVGFNILEDVGFDKRHLVVSGIMSTFKKIWVDAWSARMEYILSNALLALLEYPDSTLLSVNKMLADKKFRNDVISHITDPAVKAFWVDEWGSWTERFIQDAIPAIQNKIGQFTGNPVIRNIIGQPKSTFDLRKVMDERKIIIVNLSKGQIGEVNANLLGSLMITKIYLAAMSRADRSRDEIENLPNFYLYVDEFQSFSNDSFADILSEARKYKLNLTIAHQYIEQMEDVVRAAVFGNVGTMITFRVGSYDADVLEKEFAPAFLAEDLVNLGKFQIYLKLMIDGMGSKPFSAATMEPIKKPDDSERDKVVENSQITYGRKREVVEKIATDFLQKSDTGNKGGGSQNNNKNFNKGNNNNNNSQNHHSQKNQQDNRQKINVPSNQQRSNPQNQNPNQNQNPSSNRGQNQNRSNNTNNSHNNNRNQFNDRNHRYDGNSKHGGGFSQEKNNEGEQGRHQENKTAQPFKNVFSDVSFKDGLVSNARDQLKREREESRSDEISLNNLKKSKNRGPSEQHKNELKDALQSVLGSFPKEKPQEKNKSVNISNNDSSKKDKNTNQPHANIPKKPDKKGISDDVLKDMLKITSDDL